MSTGAASNGWGIDIPPTSCILGKSPSLEIHTIIHNSIGNNRKFKRPNCSPGRWKVPMMSRCSRGWMAFAQLLVSSLEFGYIRPKEVESLALWILFHDVYSQYFSIFFPGVWIWWILFMFSLTSLSAYKPFPSLSTKKNGSWMFPRDGFALPGCFRGLSASGTWWFKSTHPSKVRLWAKCEQRGIIDGFF